MSELFFSFGNTKVKGIVNLVGLPNNTVCTFDLPSGHTCPAADICLSYADRETGKITDGENCKFRCYAASSEGLRKLARAKHWQNYDAIKKLLNEPNAENKIAKLIVSELPKKVKIVRIHASGDFFHHKYFKAWVLVAKQLPHVDFFGYTKILPYVKYDKPDNFTLQYSMGGKLDRLHTNEPYAIVAGTEEEAEKLGLPIACVEHHSDDYLFIKAKESFVLLIHGTQQKGSKYGNNSLKLRKA